MKILDWRSPAHWKAISMLPSIKAARSFLAEFDTIKLFHGCRTAKVSSYYEDGLRIADHDLLAQRAVEIFASGAPGPTPGDIRAAVQRISSIHNGAVFAVFDREDLLRHAAHYLIYGSEMLTAIAAELMRTFGRDYRQELKRIGRPTLFELSVPMRRIAQRQIRGLAEQLASNAHEWRDCDVPPCLDFTFTFREDIPSDCVIRHEQPLKLRDPLAGSSMYEWSGEPAHPLEPSQSSGR